MLLQACLNGSLTKADHPAVPVSVEELAATASACAQAGAGAIHLHPRGSDGGETLDVEVIDYVVERVRTVSGLVVSVSTGAWIEPNVQRRVELIRAWNQPDLATVNISEEGSSEVIDALIEARIGVEAGVSTAAEVEQLVGLDAADRVTRILLEPVDVGPEDVGEVVADVHAALDRHGVSAPRLQHGQGPSTWIVLRDAIKRGIDTRIGLEDTLQGPDGEPVASNEELVGHACELGAGRDRLALGGSRPTS